MLIVFALGSLTPALAQELTQPPGPVGLRVPRVTSGALTPSRFPSKWTARHPVATGAIVGAALGGVVGFRICSEETRSKGKCRVLLVPLTAGLVAPAGMLVGFLFFR